MHWFIDSGTCFKTVLKGSRRDGKNIDQDKNSNVQEDGQTNMAQVRPIRADNYSEDINVKWNQIHEETTTKQNRKDKPRNSDQQHSK